MQINIVVLALVLADAAAAQNWQAVGGVDEGVYCVAVNPRNPNTIWFGGAAKIFISYDAGKTIGRTLANPSANTFAVGVIFIHPVDTAFVMIGASGCLQSRNNGSTWSYALPDTITSFDGESIAYEPGQPDTLYIALLRNRQNPMRIFFRSFDRGASWTNIPINALPPNSRFCSLAAGGNGLLLAGTTTRGRISRSLDYGTSWSVVYRSADSTAEVPKVTFDKQDASVVWATVWNFGPLENSTVLKSTTRGEAWEVIPLPGDPWAVETDRQGRVYVGMFALGPPGAFVSFDGGQNWRNYRTGFGSVPDVGEVWMIKSNGDPFGVYLADGTYGAYRLQNFDDVSVAGTPALPRRFTLSQNYPNPFNPETVIHYSLLENSHVELTIKNLRGETIRVLLKKFEMAGSRKVSWDGKGLNGMRVSSGVYIYTLRAGKEVLSKRMLLLR
ncbi:MAG: T9SS type A sorting domain-containing protein [bacterium]